MTNYQLSLEQLPILVKDIGQKFKNGVIILQGDLASGKTTFTKQLALYLGVEDDVTSPTFSLQQCYGDRMFHYDMYNHGLEHFISLGMLEELDKDGLHLIEWGDDKLVEILDSAGMRILIIKITKLESNIRQYEVNYAYA
ncbi:MAG: tRNA (adenosine(37)-N6)-threonylcarbamoyltransferase complex ATPase subunit type 1 TsaE [Campylobacterota bacterium]|nr:tRNA (adenosine(37)-N6)-threonylcarbamoyltransferase complex ATPase subunit type 1 TsaE [Campylobacterota bacterium]